MTGGYALCYGLCCACGLQFAFNPARVPSYRDQHGEKQPICERCMVVVNVKRKGMGLEPHPIHPQAYEPCPEEELP